MFKKCHLITVALLVFAFQCFAQKSIDTQIDSLNRIQEKLELQLSDIKSEINKLRVLNEQSRKEISSEIKYKTFMKSRVQDKENPYSELLFELKKGEIVTLHSYNPKTQYYSVSYNQRFGFLNEVFVFDNEETKSFKDIYISKFQNKLNQEQKQNDSNFKQLLVSKFGEDVVKDILAGELWLGMTDEMAIYAIGAPVTRNETVGAFGKHEQWVYDDKKLYLYFENSILKSYQKER